MIDTSKLLGALQRHIGASNGIPASILARELGCNLRHVRALITELRMEGIAVCGHPASGYFIAQNNDELETTCEFLHARAMSSLLLSSRMRKIPMADLLGQLHLPT